VVRRRVSLAIASTVLLLAAVAAARAAEPELKPAELAKALPMASLSLEQGLKISQSAGMPISAKYEIEDGALQLSVYTASNGKFREVIVDYRSGNIDKSVAITEGDDLKAAGEQAAVMSKARVPLETAVANAVRANAGYRAAAVDPVLAQGRPMATVVLMKGQEVKTVVEKLD